jgi:hypothetical protein
MGGKSKPSGFCSPYFGSRSNLICTVPVSREMQLLQPCEFRCVQPATSSDRERKRWRTGSSALKHLAFDVSSSHPFVNRGDGTHAFNFQRHRSFTNYQHRSRKWNQASNFQIFSNARFPFLSGAPGGLPHFLPGLGGLSALRERDSAQKFFSQRLAQREKLIQLDRREFPFQTRKSNQPTPHAAEVLRFGFSDDEHGSYRQGEKIYKIEAVS